VVVSMLAESLVVVAMGGSSAVHAKPSESACSAGARMDSDDPMIMMAIMVADTVTLAGRHPSSDHVAVVRSLHNGTPHDHHDHDCFEMVYVVCGTGIHHIDDSTYPIIAGDFYIMQEGDYHGYHEARNLHIINVLFSPRAFAEEDWADLCALPGLEPFLTRPHREHRHKVSLNPSAAAVVERRCAAIEQALARSDAAARLGARAALVQLLLDVERLVRVLDPEGTQGPRDPRLAAVLDHLHEHFDQPVTMEDLAAVSGWTANHCGMVFKRELGLTPVQYLGKLRIDAARSLLDESSLSITEIALEVGFEDLSYFGRQFRRACGVTPREYRRLSHG